MIEQGIVVIRLQGRAGTEQSAGRMFETFKQHETDAYYTDTKAVAAGYFILADEIEVKAFNKGMTMVDLDKKKFNDNKELNNVLTLRKKIDVGGTEGDITKAVTKRVYYKWTPDRVSILMGLVRGTYDVDKYFLPAEIVGVLAEKLSISRNKVMAAYKRFTTPNSKFLKRTGMSRYEFNKVAPIKSEYSSDSFDIFDTVENVIKHESALVKQPRVFRNSTVAESVLPAEAANKAKQVIAKRKTMRAWSYESETMLVSIYKGGMERKDKVSLIFEKAACFVPHNPVSCSDKLYKLRRNQTEVFSKIVPLYIGNDLLVYDDLEASLYADVVAAKLKAADDAKAIDNQIEEKISDVKDDAADIIIDTIKRNVYSPITKEAVEAFNKQLAKQRQEIDGAEFKDPTDKWDDIIKKAKKKTKFKKTKAKKQSVIVKAILLLTSKLNDEEKLTVVDHLFD